MAWTGEFDEGERWLSRAMQAVQADTGADIRLLVHMASGMLQAGAGVIMQRSRSSARPRICDRGSRNRTRWRAR